MSNSFIQVPPDSTGKKLYAKSNVVNGQLVHSQVYHLGDGVNPEFIQSVDNRGQAAVRFAEGSPTMDAFGNLRVSSARVLGAYEYTNTDMADLFVDATSNGGTILRDADARHMLFSTTSASGSSVSRTSNRYHYYQPGVGNLVIITLAHGDSGKENNVREWGYADESNGLLFRLSGETLQVVLRSDTSGTVEEQVIDRADWNGDKLDGTGTSGMTIDVTKANFYWIDFAWLGVGAARFGVLSPDGSRWVCHTFQNPNTNLGAYMATGSLPLHFHNYNTALTSGTSEFKLICSAIYAESTVNYTYWRASIDSGDLKPVTTNTPIVSLKPAITVNGKLNRVGIYPECLSIYVTGGPVRVHVIDQATTLTDSDWSIDNGTVLGDSAATACIGGSVFHTYYLDVGSHHIDIDKLYETNDEGYHVLADGSDAYSMTLAFTKLNPADTVLATASINYRELR